MALVAALASLVLAQAQPSGVYSLGSENMERDARALCAARYTDSLMMQAACVRNARSGATSFFEIRSSTMNVRGMKGALQGCIDRYFDGSYIDWSMLGACARNQLEAARELGL